jgi:hypothetical protein
MKAKQKQPLRFEEDENGDLFIKIPMEDLPPKVVAEMNRLYEIYGDKKFILSEKIGPDCVEFDLTNLTIDKTEPKDNQ